MSLARKSIFLALVLLAAVAATELALRVFEPKPAAALQREDAIYASSKFVSIGQAVKVVAGHNREVEYIVGPEGFRGRPSRLSSRAAGKRILVLGAASVFGLGLEEGATFPAQLEQRLSRTAGCENAEVINAGIPGANLSDIMGRLLGELYLVQPDAVLLYHGWNELRILDSSASVESQAAEARERVMRLMPSPSSFAILRFLRRLPGSGLHNGNFSTARPLAKPPGGPLAEVAAPEGLRQIGASLAAFIAAVRALGAEPVLIPELTLVTRNLPPEERAGVFVDDNFSEAARLSALQAIRVRIQEAARASGARLVNLEREFDGKKAYFADQVHLTPAGAAALAERLAAELSPLLCARQRR